VSPDPSHPDARLLDGRTALVTGAGSGIGRAIAAGLASHGAVVRVADADPATDPDHVVDVSDDASVTAMFVALDSDLGGLDILINNVGIAGPTGPVEDLDPAEFDRCIAVNIGGTYRCMRHAVSRLKEGGGSVINISSTAGQQGYPLRSPYAASKWAINGLTASWAMELGRFGVRVNAIAPGTVAGPRMDGVIGREAAAAGLDAAEIKAAYEDQSSMRSFVTAEDIAATASFLCSDAARLINGQVVGVDGHNESARTAFPDGRRAEIDVAW
jgi:NAD(P)-dependent dehydrogenase (short-subunit alcohol dehydrogenase family)